MAAWSPWITALRVSRLWCRRGIPGGLPEFVRMNIEQESCKERELWESWRFLLSTQKSTNQHMHASKLSEAGERTTWLYWGGGQYLVLTQRRHLIPPVWLENLIPHRVLGWSTLLWSHLRHLESNYLMCRTQRKMEIPDPKFKTIKTFEMGRVVC